MIQKDTPTQQISNIRVSYLTDSLLQDAYGYKIVFLDEKNPERREFICRHINADFFNLDNKLHYLTKVLCAMLKRKIPSDPFTAEEVEESKAMGLH